MLNYNREQYIKINDLQDSYIDKKILYQYRRVLPERKEVGKTIDGNKIFFEETRGSLVKRNYGKSDVVTSWNLLISDGEKSEILTQEKFNAIIDIIKFTAEFSSIDIENFIANNTKRTNALISIIIMNFFYCSNPNQLWPEMEKINKILWSKYLSISFGQNDKY